ncbi:hypothetical protein [Treponema denticola]|uniref:hypothetical protein n=1 Tax=Treponema denticola TaxID=158 RepID=UPI0020A51F53|nr:hypothetical protein [Treponema denticola]
MLLAAKSSMYIGRNSMPSSVFLSLEETKIEEAKTLEYFLRNIFKDSCLPIPEDFTSIAFTFAP